MIRNSITLIIIYFGEWPKWGHYFLESCAKNNDISFLIFTDQLIALDQSSNLKFINFGLLDFHFLASQKLKLRIDFADPYKICDFRPSFGVIFEDYLKDSSFWGHIDIDVIFGDIRHFITDLLLKDNDILTARKEYLVGHFTLYRNSEKVNTLYMQTDDYKDIFSSEEYAGFDECCFLWWQLMAGHEISSLTSKYMSMTHLTKKLQLQDKIRVLFKPLVLEQNHNNVFFERKLKWENGILRDLDSNESFLYFHFHFLKKRADFLYPKWESSQQSFFISNKGFSLVNSNL